VTKILQLWQTTTVRLTAIFILIFVIASIGLLAFMAYQSSIVIQQSQTRDIEREVAQLQRTEARRGVRAVALAVQTLSNRPGPGIYYLGDEVGRKLVGNVSNFPANVLAEEGFHTFHYERERAFSPVESEREDDDERPEMDRGGFALVKSVNMQSGLRLVVGRDILERRGFSAIIFRGFFFGVVGIVVLSAIAGGLTARRVLRRIDSISNTSGLIMSGNMSERVPVTDRNDEFDRLATSLNAMLDRIEQLMTGLKDVTDNVAHDLKTPLTRMRNKAESALRDGVSPEDRKAALESTIEESDQLIRTFNALLLIARVEAGTPSGAFTDIDISEVINDVAELYAPVAEDAGMQLETELDGALILHANRELISQALVNLVENAIKYANAESTKNKTITLGATKRGTDIIIEVADHGPGVPDGEHDKVVERFVRLEKSRTEPGSGLGLSLVSAVARLHKGTLELTDNKPGVRAILKLSAKR
jgi:signal transduction histidine kinase